MDTKGFNWTTRDLKEIREQITYFKSFRLKPINQDNFLNAFRICYVLFDKVPLPTVRVDVPYILRGRPNFNGQIFSEEWELSYHSRDFHLIKAGRFNRPHEPMFYGSVPNEIHPTHFLCGVIRESCKTFFDTGNTDPHQYVTFGKFFLKNHFDVVNLCYDKKLIRMNPILGQAMEDHRQKTYKIFPPNTADFIIEFWFFLSQLAASAFENSNDHFLTTIFWRALINYRMDTLKLSTTGLLYPNTQTENQGINIVLQPQIVDEVLHLRTVFMAKMTRSKDNPHHADIEQCSKEVPVNKGKFSLVCDF